MRLDLTPPDAALAQLVDPDNPNTDAAVVAMLKAARPCAHGYWYGHCPICRHDA